MRKWMALLLVCLWSDPAPAQQIVREFSWSELKAGGSLKNGDVVSAAQGSGIESLEISNQSTQPVRIEVMVIDQPGITEAVYALRGRVRYEGVEGVGYLEMWSHFPDGSAYFSRTLAGQGPMANLSGTSAWRDMALPFSAAGTTKRPSRLVFNVVQPGKGRVWIGSLRLVQYRQGEDPLASSGEWWTERDGGLIGGIGGAVMGLAGALIGVLSARGRSRTVVLAVMALVTALSAIALAAGIFAVTHGQPYGVYYPLLLGGGLGFMLFGGLRPMVRRRYDEIELRRMSAADAV
jgi:hypothetical protein